MRTLSWTSNAWEEYVYWQNQDRKTLKRINKLIEDCLRGDPREGIGKPEALKFELQGFWSRRIDDSNRLVYSFSDDNVTIVQCRFHYDK